MRDAAPRVALLTPPRVLPPRGGRDLPPRFDPLPARDTPLNRKRACRTRRGRARSLFRPLRHKGKRREERNLLSKLALC
jgi:hypothetical protein